MIHTTAIKKKKIRLMADSAKSFSFNLKIFRLFNSHANLSSLELHLSLSQEREREKEKKFNFT